jgi:hypothetical protein
MLDRGCKRHAGAAIERERLDHLASLFHGGPGGCCPTHVEASLDLDEEPRTESLAQVDSDPDTP